MKKVALITGANRGIGFVVARQLQDAGMQVILTARNIQKGKDAAETIDADFMELDVASWSSIHQLVRRVKEKYGKIDVLVNNAGILTEHSNILEISRQKVEETIQTNALGPLYITQAFQDDFNPQAQVVMVSSALGAMSGSQSNYAPLYSASKTFLNALTRHLAGAFQEKQVSVNAVSPGWVQTDMGSRGADRSVEQGAETIVWLAQGKAEGRTGCFFKDRQEIPW